MQTSRAIQIRQWLMSPVCVYIYNICMQQKSHTHVNDPVVQIEVGGLWKRQNNPACTKSVSVEVEH